MPGQATSEQLRRLARPVKARPRAQLAGRQIHRRRFGSHPQRRFGTFGFGVGEILPPVQSQQGRQFRVAPAGKQPRLPAHRRGGVGDGGDGVAAVVLAIPIGAQAVFPGFAPMNAGQRQHYPTLQFVSPRGEIRRGALFEAVIVAQVVMNPGGQTGDGGADQVTFGRMQIAARRITTQRPARAALLLPGGQSQRQFEQQRQRIAFERVGGGSFASAHGLERGGQGIGPQRQFDARRSRETAKRIGLVGPVESARSRGIAVQVVLARLVIGDDSCNGVGIVAVEDHDMFASGGWAGGSLTPAIPPATGRSSVRPGRGNRRRTG